ncbi:MAG: hypothetical protein JNL70_23290 [Saprospiraceae bacterium]|nr:hypothetical protein [Saprospiraceae bacterium]
MKTLFFQLILSSLFINLSCTNSNSQPASEVKESKMKWSLIHAGNQCGVEDAKQVLIKSQEEFDDIWQLCFQNMPAPIAKPTIDFSKEWVIGYFSGSSKGGQTYNLDDIGSTANGIKVAITHSKPGKNCVTVASIDMHYVLARVDHFRPDKVEYALTEKTVDCN